ncbi:MFS transporter [Botrimarina sp.]|uniref:MFS transporter n=1 Tax=Botrimarina sp. TaxID=2795802 RepID=UPI0032EF85C2
MSSPADRAPLARPARDPAYAWVMLPVAILMHVGTSPGQTFGVALFNEPIRESLGLTATQLSGAYMVASLLAAVPLVWLGKRMDRHGLKLLSLALVTAVGLGCLAISQVRSLVSLTLCFFALRAFGQGGLSLAANNTLGMWFSRRLGLASGIAGVGMATGIAIVPLGLHTLIEEFGWRNAYAIAGIVTMACLLPLIALAYRNNEEPIAEASQPTGTPFTADRELSFRAALRTPAYWIASACTALVGLVCTALFFNLAPLMQQGGFSAAQTAALFPTVALAMAAMQINGGVLADRVPLRFLVAVAVAALGAGALVLGNAATLAAAHAGGALIGAGQGLMAVSGNTLWPRYFGRKELGAIRSSVWTATVAACSVGPFLMDVTLDLTGGYSLSLWLFAAMAATASVAAAVGAAPPTAAKAPAPDEPIGELVAAG